jgi:hypothetical protein
MEPCGPLQQAYALPNRNLCRLAARRRPERRSPGAEAVAPSPRGPSPLQR